MLGLIVLVIFGLGMAYFATQNTMPTIVYIANYRLANIPMYLIVIGSLLLGMFISWIVSIADSFSSNLTIHGKDSTIKAADRTIDELQEEKHELEVENARLREKEKAERPSLAHRLKHSFS